ncbi:MAG: hypothetical protein J7J91_06030, partial [Deltaproteobacteria bacterium]|nr:hypothetical protein [Deltaproteobacteria bacterium]
IADLPLRQDLLAKNVLMTAQRNFCLGNSPLIRNWIRLSFLTMLAMVKGVKFLKPLSRAL